MIIPVNSVSGSYNITLERGALKRVGEIVNLKRKTIIITDDGVPCEYVETVKKQCDFAVVMRFPQGEATKSFRVLQKILKNMVTNAFDRNDCVIAVGGGVIGDLSGFVASTYMRGIDFYNIPTTLLSQVDSSIGGKVAVNFLGYKNIVGAFYPPKAVIIDPDVLKTLPERHISNGLAEAVKMAVTCNKNLFEYFEKNGNNFDLEYVIEHSLKIKKFVVENDEKEHGLRKVLNFGHTIGHAIESSINMLDWYHGECVAAGMLLTCSKEVKERLSKVLITLNLPTYIPCSIIKMTNAVSHDKKVNGESISEVFVNEIGSFEIKNITQDNIKRLIKTEYKI